MQLGRKSSGKRLNPTSVAATSVGTADITVKEVRLYIRDFNSNFSFLVDSGSVISAIPRFLICDAITPIELKLNAANNSEIKTYGMTWLNIDLGLRRAFKFQFIVADVNIPILGADFLTTYGLLIDLKQGVLTDPLTNLSSSGELRKTNLFSISTVERAKDFRGLLAEFVDISRPSSFPKAPADCKVQHSIITTGQPVSERLRRLSGEKLVAAKNEINSLLDQGVLQPSSSPWASPIHMVKKPNGTWRMCGDYRKINSQTIPDRYPPPMISDLFERLSGKTVFSKLDLVKAFHQIPMNVDDVQKTAIITPVGLFEYLVMPFGLRNAAQTCQRFLDTIFRGDDFVFSYIDDIFIMSESTDQHEAHLRVVFNKLRENNLVVNLDKCSLAKERIEFLGFHIDQNGYSPLPQKVEAINNFPKPQTIEELRRFIGMVNYYHSCIPGLANIQVPLTNFLRGSTKKKDKSKVPWDDTANSAFVQCKNSLSNVTRLAFPAPDAPLVLKTDASSSAIGAVLEQCVENSWQPIGFFSRKLSQIETRYSTYDRELLAIFSGVKHFKNFLEGRPFIIHCDHKPLKYAFSQKLDKASPRQIRQLEYISQFSTEIVYIEGPSNIVADALSRVCSINIPQCINLESLLEEQLKDPELEKLLNEGNILQLDMVDIDGVELFTNSSRGYNRPYVPLTLRQQVFDLYHSLAHPGGRTTLKLISDKYVWPNIRRDVLKRSKECIPCQRAKISRHNKLVPKFIKMPDSRFEHIHIDIIHMPEVDGFKYCLTIIDRFSRFPMAIPMKDVLAATVADLLFKNWICLFGAPCFISTDRGSQFESKLFDYLATIMGIKRIRTTAYHPASNGFVERWHRTLKSALMCHAFISWVEALPAALLGLRTAYKYDLQASPAEMLFGTTLRVPGDFFSNTDPNLDPNVPFIQKHRKAMLAMRPVPTSHHIAHNLFLHKDIYDSSHVFLRLDDVAPPLRPPYSGPHEVVERLDDRRFVINLDGKIDTVSVERLKPAFITQEDSNSLTSRKSVESIGLNLQLNKLFEEKGHVVFAC